jgi:site-specific recombinase XerD
LDVVRDIFLFGIYTGYSYKDITKLQLQHIFKKEDNRLYIVKNRIKTENTVAQPCEVPILPPVKRLIEKYSNDPRCVSNRKLIPDLSNTKLNEYLKEIQTLCEIEKKLHFHLARHTFATTITLAKGVSIEIVALMLGHTRLTTTQHYAKLVNGKLFYETGKLHDIYR